jgi:hypothetical protein
MSKKLRDAVGTGLCPNSTGDVASEENEDAAGDHKPVDGVGCSSEVSVVRSAEADDCSRNCYTECSADLATG